MDSRSLLIGMHRGPSQVERGVLADLTGHDQLVRPQGMNSIAWLLWHVTRCEDVAVHGLIRGTAEVLDDGWLDRLGLDATLRHIGTESTEAELQAFHSTLSLDALHAYRAAVLRATEEWLLTADADTLAVVPDMSRLRPDATSGPAAWVRDFWTGNPASFFVAWLGIGHAYLHLGEAQVTRSALGAEPVRVS